jgi:hypothetical protein
VAATIPRFASFRDFYPYYLGEHSDPMCRRLHFLGTTLVISAAVTLLASGNLAWLAVMPVVGYGPAWAGHFFFEHNRPATFSYPLYSLAGDFVMYGQMLTRRLPF